MLDDLGVGERVVVRHDGRHAVGAGRERPPGELDGRRGRRPTHVGQHGRPPVRGRERRPDDRLHLVRLEQRPFAGRSARHQRVDALLDEPRDVRGRGALVDGPVRPKRGRERDDDLRHETGYR